jgi:ribose transport system permease protein
MIKSLVRQRFFVILVLLILMIIFFALTQERFFTLSNFTVILTSSSILWVAAMGLTFVMIAGGFDLSVGSMMALCGIALGYFSNQLDLNLAVAIFLTLLFGVVVGGLINGLAIGKLGLSFLVVTLGSSTLFIGLTQFWSGTKTSAIENKNLQILAYESLFFIPNQVVVMILVYLILLYVQKFTLFGRDIYAIGGNKEAAKLSGINTVRIIVMVYALAAGFAALAGVIQDARIGAASPQV